MLVRVGGKRGGFVVWKELSAGSGNLATEVEGLERGRCAWSFGERLVHRPLVMWVLWLCYVYG